MSEDRVERAGGGSQVGELPFVLCSGREEELTRCIPGLCGALCRGAFGRGGAVLRLLQEGSSADGATGQVDLVMAELLSDKKIAKATCVLCISLSLGSRKLISRDDRHNISAFRLTTNGLSLQDNDDDGENAAGSRLAHLLTLLVRPAPRGSEQGERADESTPRRKSKTSSSSSLDGTAGSSELPLVCPSEHPANLPS